MGRQIGFAAIEVFRNSVWQPCLIRLNTDTSTIYVLNCELLRNLYNTSHELFND